MAEPSTSPIAEPWLSLSVLGWGPLVLSVVSVLLSLVGVMVGLFGSLSGGELAVVWGTLGLHLAGTASVVLFEVGVLGDKRWLVPFYQGLALCVLVGALLLLTLAFVFNGVWQASLRNLVTSTIVLLSLCTNLGSCALFGLLVLCTGRDRAEPWTEPSAASLLDKLALDATGEQLAAEVDLVVTNARKLGAMQYGRNGDASASAP